MHCGADAEWHPPRSFSRGAIEPCVQTYWTVIIPFMPSAACGVHT